MLTLLFATGIIVAAALCWNRWSERRGTGQRARPQANGAASPSAAPQGGAARPSPAPVPALEPRAPAIELSFSVTSGSGRHCAFPNPGATPLIDVGDVVEAGPDAWCVNPKAPFKLTLERCRRSDAERARALLERGRAESRTVATELNALIARANIQCKEVNEYVAHAKPQYLGSIERMKRDSAEWGAATEKDREDLLAGYRNAALDALPVRPSCDLRVLFECEPKDATFDDALIDHYGFSPLQLYFRFAQNIGRPRVVPADHWDRTGFEELVTKGLARTGGALPLEVIAETLTVKQLNQLLEGPKAIPRKAQAVAAVVSLPDARERLGRLVASREVFQLLPLAPQFASINVQALSDSWQHAAVVASLILETYVSAVRALESIEEVRADRDKMYRGWTVDTWADDPCPLCAAAKGKALSKRSTPKVPFHIGCRCSLDLDWASSDSHGTND